MGGFRVKSTDVILIPLCFMYLLPRLIVPRTRLPRQWHTGLPLWLMIVAAFGAMSTTWSGLSGRDALAMQFTMAVTAASGLLAYCVISSVSDVRAFLTRFVLALSAVSLLYSAQSVLRLGLRSSIAIRPEDFGIDRVRGPLFESSTGYFLLIPALAFILQETLSRRVRPFIGVTAVFSLTVGVLGLGSRAGYMLLGLFVLGCFCAAKGIRKAAVLATIVIALGVAGVAVFRTATADRLQVTQKDGRILMHEAVWNMIATRTIPQLFLGSGLGAWWPWYVTELDGGDLYATGLHSRSTKYGVLLYHSHSTILALGVELGLVGICFLLALSRRVMTSLRQCIRSGMDSMFSIGVAVSVLSLGFDLFLLRRPTRDAVWWILLFGLLALVAQQQSKRSRTTA
jgi:O-antigen ligase